MEQFYEYIFTGSFGEYNLERMEMIEDFFANVGKKNKFFDSETYEAVIMFLIERNNITQAREILFTAREMFHDNVVYRALEVIIDLKDNLNKAISHSTKYYKETLDIVFLFTKAVAYFDQKNYDKGAKVFDSFCKKVENSDWRSEAYLQMAIYLNGDKYEVVDEPDEEFMTRTMLIKKLVDKALKCNAEVDDKMLFFYALQFQMLENVREAKTILNRIIDSNSYHRDAWRLLSEILFEDEQYAEAAEAYKYRIAINDGNTMNHFQCGVCYSRLGKWADALHYYELQEKNYPVMLMDNKEFYCTLKNNQAECLMKMGAFDRALELCRKTLEIDPNNFQSLVKIAQCHYFMGDSKEAVEYLLKALKMHNDYQNNEYESLFETVGDIFTEISENQEDADKRESLYNSVLAYSKSFMFLNVTGKAENRNFEDIQVQNAIRMLKIGRSYTILGDYTSALVNFQLANYMHSEIPTLQLFLTICYFRLGFTQEAFIHFERIPTSELEQFKSFMPELSEIEKKYRENNNLPI